MQKTLGCIALSLLMTGCAQLAGLGEFSDRGGAGGTAGGPGGGGSGGGGSDGGGGSGASEGGGGVGGVGGCGEELGNDDNCGACNHYCGGGECQNGICTPVALETGAPLGALVVAGEVVYFVEGNGLLRSFDANADFGRVNVLMFGGLGDRVGVFTAGPQKIYYAPRALDNGTTAQLYACSAGGCDQYLFPGLQGAYFTGLMHRTGTAELIGVTSDPDNRLYTIPLINHAPSAALLLLPEFATPTPDGLDQAHYDRLNDVVFVSDSGVGSCVYRARMVPTTDDPVGCLGIFKNELVGSYFGHGRLYAFSSTEFFSLDPTSGNDSESDVPSRGPVATDEGHTYVGVRGGGFAVLDRANKLLAEFPAAPLSSVDASHPDYVFYTAGFKLFRWRKLPGATP